MSRQIEKKLKQSFLKQIQDYNDFIVQNDLDADMVNVDHDYDFSAFTSPEDWAVESERLADRLSDRKMEIKQNEDAGEFAGMELENGVPSSEAVDNMSDEQFKAYEEKYLTPSEATEPQVVKMPEVVEDVVAPADTNATDVNASAVPVIVTPPDQNKTVPMNVDSSPAAQINPAPVKNEEYEFSLPVAWELFKGTHPGIQNAVDAVDSVGKVIDQGQPINALQDAGRGVMSGLADTAGSIADLGGLLPNKVSDMAHESADWWKDQYEIVDSEAGNVGDDIGSEAVAGAAGGVVGKVAGKVYKSMKEGGEALRKRATTVAKDTEKRAKLHGLSPLEQVITRQKAYENMTNVPPRHGYTKAFIGDAQPIAGSARIDPIPYGHPMTKEDLLTKAIREKNHLAGKDLDGGGYSAYDVLNPVAGKMEYPTTTRLLDTALHNAKRKVDSRAMLQRNDAELNDLYGQGTPLDKALKTRQDRWDQIPSTVRDVGTALGLGVAM